MTMMKITIHDDENNNSGGSTDFRKQKLSIKPHKTGKVVRLLAQDLRKLVNGIKTLLYSQAVRHKKDLEENQGGDELLLKYRAEEKE